MDTMWKTVYLCEDSVEGILTAVYDAWSVRRTSGEQELRIKNSTLDNYELFAEYVGVVTDEEKARKVLRSVRTKLSHGLAYKILKAAMSVYADRGQVVYEVLQYSFAKKRDCSNDLSVPCNSRLMELLRYYANEEHLMLGFLRFQPLAPGSWIAFMSPKNHILPGLMEHFSARFGTESFLIVDEGRSIVGVYRADNALWQKNAWIVVELEEAMRNRLDEIKASQDLYADLWHIFFDTIAISERTNERCQRNLCPLWYRTYMTEFSQRSAENRSERLREQSVTDDIVGNLEGGDRLLLI